MTIADLVKKAYELAMLKERLALALCELGHVPDPRLPELTSITVEEAFLLGGGGFEATLRGFTVAEVEAIIAAPMMRAGVTT